MLEGCWKNVKEFLERHKIRLSFSSVFFLLGLNVIILSSQWIFSARSLL